MSLVINKCVLVVRVRDSIADFKLRVSASKDICCFKPKGKYPRKHCQVLQISGRFFVCLFFSFFGSQSITYSLSPVSYTYVEQNKLNFFKKALVRETVSTI